MVTNENYPYETVSFGSSSNISTKGENWTFKYDENGKLIREDAMKADYSTYIYEYDEFLKYIGCSK